MDIALVLQGVFLLVALLCPLSIVAIAGWAAWSRRRSAGAPRVTDSRSAVEENEISRMRVALASRDGQAPQNR